MQRIKSQSTCNSHSIAITSQSRPRSKKNSKPQSSQIVYCNADRIKHSQGNISQNSMVSVKSHSKLLAGSSKNLRTGPYQNIGKNSVQNTTRGANGQNSAISARILKQIVGYSHRGVSGSKVQNNDEQHLANKQQIRLKIDLDQQIKKVYKKQQEDQPRTTLSQDRHKSYTTSYKKSQENQQSSNKKKEIKIMKGNKNQPSAIKQFQPMGIAYEKQAKLKYNNQDKKCSFFNSIDQECVQGGSSQLYQIQNRSLIRKGKQFSKMSNLTIQNYSKEEQIQNNHDITKNFMKINSPHCNNIPLRQKQAQNFTTNKSQKQLYLNKQNNRKISNKMIGTQLKLMKYVNIYEEDCQNQQQEALIQEKQKLIINLQQSTVLLEQNYQFKYKQIIPFWKSLIESQTMQNQIQEQISKLQLSLKQYQIKDLAKKSQLFQLNRDQLCRRKQKQYVTKSSKQKYLQQAISCQQALKLKLSSKADYEHVVLFNQKVILSGQSSFDDLHKIFVQMFENKLSKKFALIAKKQLANLSVYDSRLVQDFLKRIQQLESLHNKSEMNTAGNNPSQSNICHYSSVTEQQRLEIIIEQIQQLILNIQFINSKITMKKSQLSDLQAKIKQYTRIMQKQIKNKNKIISEQYKMAEGFIFDFQELLQEKYDKQFQQYRKELSYRNQIIKNLNIIQRKLNQCIKSKQYESANQSDKNSQKSFRKQPNRNSVSFVTTPTNRSPLRIEKDYRPHQLQIQQNRSGRMFKKSIHA